MKAACLIVLLGLIAGVPAAKAQYITQDSVLVAGGNYSTIGWPAGVRITIPPATAVTLGSLGSTNYGGGILSIYGTLTILSSTFEVGDSFQVHKGATVADSGALMTALVLVDTNGSLTTNGKYSTYASGAVSDHYYTGSVVTYGDTATYNSGGLVLDSGAILNTKQLHFSNPNNTIRGKINNTGTIISEAQGNTISCPGSISTQDFTNFAGAPWIMGTGFIAISGVFISANAFTFSNTIVMDIDPQNTGGGNPGAATLGNTSPCPPQTALGITVTEFTVTTDHRSAWLQWRTATERNNSGFHVQRSQDAIHWDEIRFMNSAAADGNTVGPAYYNYKDQSPLYGRSYYRLIQEDWDGSTSASSVCIFYSEQKQMDLHIYPLPVGSGFTVLLSSDVSEASYRLLDCSGRVLQKGNFRVGNNSLYTSGLAPGIYLLNVAHSGKDRIFRLAVYD